MKRGSFVPVFLLFFIHLSAQNISPLIKDRIEFCDSNLSNEETIQLKKEIIALEKYFINSGLLRDTSGISYKHVYDQIVKDDDLIFELDTSFFLLDNLDFQVFTTCFYKVLTRAQIFEITERHLDAAKKISAPYEGNVTPGVIAKRILENLSINDFDLKYYKISSLLVFYKIANAFPNISIGLPQKIIEGNIDHAVKLNIILNDKSQTLIESQHYSSKEIEKKVYDFLNEEPTNKAIEITAFRKASYDSYLELTEIILKVYTELRQEMSIKLYEKNYSELNSNERSDIDLRVPKNIIFKEPK